MSIMRSSFALTLLVVVFVACHSVSAEPAAVTQIDRLDTSVRILNGVSSRRYLKGRQTTTSTDDEERLLSGVLQKMPGLNKIKAAFQKNPSFAKNLEKFRLKRQRLDEFFKENPVIKKEIIVATTPPQHHSNSFSSRYTVIAMEATVTLLQEIPYLPSSPRPVQSRGFIAGNLAITLVPSLTTPRLSKEYVGSNPSSTQYRIAPAILGVIHSQLDFSSAQDRVLWGLRSWISSFY
ncbi:hypothetical protein L917_09093 [Phytophthora nicotianae]|uniref:RxLR effector protein n=1 Tax=Phytophthora nicotianae TaxID=4792 RepID=W2L788_PHYNI|nr:hypothetical protein L917_09093 [Phytophthora nicotianae]